MTVENFAPLLSNVDVKRRTEVLMLQHAEKLDQDRPGYLAVYVEAAQLRGRVREARAVLCNPTVPDADKVAVAVALLDGAPRLAKGGTP